mgnify:FL=1
MIGQIAFITARKNVTYHPTIKDEIKDNLLYKV